MTTGSVTSGSGLSGVMVRTPLPRLKVIASVPPLLLAALIASRNEPTPESAVVVTGNVANSLRASSRSTHWLGRFTPPVRPCPIDFFSISSLLNDASPHRGLPNGVEPSRQDTG